MALAPLTRKLSDYCNPYSKCQNDGYQFLGLKVFDEQDIKLTVPKGKGGGAGVTTGRPTTPLNKPIIPHTPGAPSKKVSQKLIIDWLDDLVTQLWNKPLTPGPITLLQEKELEEAEIYPLPEGMDNTAQTEIDTKIEKWQYFPFSFSPELKGPENPTAKNKNGNKLMTSYQPDPKQMNLALRPCKPPQDSTPSKGGSSQGGNSQGGTSKGGNPKGDGSKGGKSKGGSSQGGSSKGGKSH
jgi:hypothetical protein